MKENAAKIVSAALLGTDGEKITINGKEYGIKPPTIKQIVGAGQYLSSFGDEKITGDYIRQFKEYEGLCKAASWFIVGNEELRGPLHQCTLEDILGILEKAFSLIGIQNFARLSTLAKNVKMAIAKQR